MDVKGEQQMCDKVKNIDLFKFYLREEVNNCSCKNTRWYDEARKTCEECGMSIQAGERVFHAIRSNRRTTAGQLFENCENWNEEKISIASKTELTSSERRKILKILNANVYDQQWHLIISYYLYSSLNEQHGFLDKYVSKIEWDCEIEENPWCLKGKRSRIRDPLLILWMLEAGGVKVPEQIISIYKNNGACKHANKETDRKVLEVFYDGKLCKDCWKELMANIKNCE